MGEALARHDQLLRRTIERHRGQIFKTVGDAFYAMFAAAPDAGAAAIAIQQALAAEDFSAVNGIRVRIAIHSGSVERRDNDFFGPPLNRVARMLSIAHGGQILVSAIAAELLRSGGTGDTELRDLGRHRLKDLTHPEHVFQLVVPDLPQNFAPLRSIDALPNNLPEQITSFIGREEELDLVIQFLREHRLVTLVGPGGLGKTRLSLQAAAEVLEARPDGVWFAELAPLNEPQLVEELVAGLFGLSWAGERNILDLLAGYLRHRNLLLILDNCEHLLAAAATLSARLIRSCPQVAILASSREPLGIQGEQIYRLPPLPIPSAERGLTAAEARNSPAVRLLVERAKSALGRFELTDENAADLTKICRRLDGIALAIELAAPRLVMLKPKQLLARLDDRFRLLTGGDRTALPRQQTLHALIDWSYGLLNDPERIVMRRLSVFAGSFSLESAAAVVAGDPVDEFDVFDLLASLVNKSLVSTDGSGAEIRYRLLESTRSYAAEKLVAAGEGHWTRRLAEDLARRMRMATEEYETTPTGEWVATYGPEIDNLRAALDWSFGPTGDRELGLELQAFSGCLWMEFSLRAEWLRRLEAAAVLLRPDTPPEISARIKAARLRRTGLGRSGLEELRAVIDIARTSGDALLLAGILVQISIRLLASAETTEARGYLEEAKVLVGARGSTKTLASIFGSLGAAAYVEGDVATAGRCFRESLSIARLIGDRLNVDAASQNLAELLFIAGDLDAAIAAGREALQAAEEGSAQHSVCPIMANLGAYLLLRGDQKEGQSLARRALKEALAVGEPLVAAWAIQHLALAFARSGRAADAARLQGFVDSVYATEQATREPTEQATCDLALAMLAISLSETDRSHFLAQGANLSLDEAGSLALSLG